MLRHLELAVASFEHALQCFPRSDYQYHIVPYNISNNNLKCLHESDFCGLYNLNYSLSHECNLLPWLEVWHDRVNKHDHIRRDISRLCCAYNSSVHSRHRKRSLRPHGLLFQVNRFCNNWRLPNLVFQRPLFDKVLIQCPKQVWHPAPGHHHQQHAHSPSHASQCCIHFRAPR